MKITKKTKKVMIWVWGLVFSPFLLIAILIVLANWGVFGPMPSFDDLENPQSKLATKIYSDETVGVPVELGKFYLENRSHISYGDLSPHLVTALIATEDVRFSQHSGIDFISLRRVFIKTFLMQNTKAGGGSTISQQLALNLFAERSDNRLKRVIQKLQEWITAVKLERNYTKSEIIAMYFNTVPFGSNAFGIEAASKTFFNKEPKELNIEESALLVGVVNAPTFFSPVRNPERSKGRRDLVIRQMVKASFLTKEKGDSIQKIDIKLNFKAVDHNSGSATYFREMLRQTMKMQKPVEADYKYRTPEEYQADLKQWDENPLYGWCNKNSKNGRPYNLDRDGLKIYTTINSKMQQYAEEAVEEHLSKTLQPEFDKQRSNRKRFPFSNFVKESDVADIVNKSMRGTERYKAMKKSGASDTEIETAFNTPTEMTVFTWRNATHEVDTVMSPRDSIMYYKSLLRTAFMAMEPHTGKIRAYVGGPNFRYFKFDNAWQGRRQVGSTIKPFLYSLAMQEGMTPCSEVINNRQIINLESGGVWSPESSENSAKLREKYLGKHVTLKWGLANSSNNVSAWLIQRFSPQSLIELCHNMGITSFMDPTPSVCLGPSDISLYQMVGAYNTYPSKGIHIDPVFVTRIEDSNGNLLAVFDKSQKEVMSRQTAYLTLNLMQGVVNAGTGARARAYLSGAVAAGKTGTTNKNSDGWFIGYVPKLTAGAWVGNEDRGSYLLSDGARQALPIWGLFFQKVLADKSLDILTNDSFDVPPGLDQSQLNCKGGEEDSKDGEEESEELFF